MSHAQKKHKKCYECLSSAQYCCCLCKEFVCLKDSRTILERGCVRGKPGVVCRRCKEEFLAEQREKELRKLNRRISENEHSSENDFDKFEILIESVVSIPVNYLWPIGHTNKISSWADESCA